MEPKTLIEIKNVTAGYSKTVPVLKNISAQIPAGRCLCVVRPNGAGKSTFLKLIIGVFHDLLNAVEIADDIMMIKDGGITAYGPPGEVLSSQLLKDIYDTDVAAHLDFAYAKWKNTIEKE